MYLIRRIARTQPGKAWEVAGLLTKICQAYEANGRNKAQIFIGGQGLPGEANVVYAEWTQERIEPNRLPNVPKSVFEDNPKLQALLTSLCAVSVVRSSARNSSGLWATSCMHPPYSCQ